jgi:hypothetical protein
MICAEPRATFDPPTDGGQAPIRAMTSFCTGEMTSAAATRVRQRQGQGRPWRRARSRDRRKWSSAAVVSALSDNSGASPLTRSASGIQQNPSLRSARRSFSSAAARLSSRRPAVARTSAEPLRNGV